MDFDIKAMAKLDSYKLLTGLVVPRPIAFVSSVSPDGVFNAAPFSFFNMFGVDPAVVVLGINSRPDGLKDSYRNIVDTGEFVINVATAALAEQVNAASADVAPEVDEFALVGLTPLPSTVVKAPRIGESPANLECRLTQMLAVAENRSLVVGEIVYVHVNDAIVSGVKVDQAGLDAIGRMGGPWYSRTRDSFQMIRPGGGGG